MKIGKRNMVRVISFGVALVTTLAVWGTVATVKLNKANMSINQSNERALTQLGTYLDDITLNLQKASYVSGEMMLTKLSTELWRSSVAAKESLSELTDFNTELSGIYKFLSQVGEYTLSVNREISAGSTLSDDDAENLEALLGYSRNLSNTVNYLIEQRENGLLDFEDIESTLLETESENLYLGGELNDADQSLSDYPTLVYDGPFSDNLTEKTSVMLEDMEEISQDDALLRASEFSGIPSDELSLLNIVEGNLPAYTFYSDTHTVSVTRNGGIVNSMLTWDYAGEISLTYEEAVKKASDFLKEKGYEDMSETYYSSADGICTVNFAYYSKGAIHYTDLIKVSVALDDGRITAFDSTGYIMNHRTRSVPEGISVSAPEAKHLIKDNLTVISYKRAYIPTEWGSEVYAYEFRCTDKNKQEVLLYIDPVSGEEIDVLLLLYADGGVLTK